MEKAAEKLMERGELLLFGEIDEEASAELIENLLYLAKGKRSARRKRPITIWINSTGGLLQPAFALADLFEKLPCPVRTIGIGSVESAASMVLMAGTRGQRMVTRNCSIMVHEYTWSNSGSYTEMQGRLKEVHGTRAKQLAMMERHTGKPAAQLHKILRHEETWLSPSEAIAWGLVDRVY